MPLLLMAILWTVPPPACPPMVRLDGAAITDAGGAAAFNSSWTAALDGFAACLQQPAQTTACVVVQGQYDRTPFSPATRRAVGGQVAGDMLRARGRGIRVLSALHARGLRAEQLREAPPGLAPTWRGVALTLQPDCLPDRERERRLLAVIASLTAAPSAPPAPPRPIRPQLRAQVEPKDVRRDFWVGAGTTAQWIGGAEHVFGGALGVDLGWQPAGAYLRVAGRVLAARPAEQRVGVEVGIAGGWRPRDWLRVGLQIGHRVTAPQVLDPWLAQVWTVGFEAAQRVWTPSPGLHLTLRQAAAPFGQRWQQGRVRDGAIHLGDGPARTIFRIDLGLALERDF